MLRTMPLLLLLLGLLLSARPASAQEITFTASVDKQAIAAGEVVQLTVSLTNAQGGFSAPDLGGMVVVQGPFESTNVNFFNGRMISSVNRTWRITATAPGKYTIGPAKARVGGGIIETDPITIEVGPATTKPADPQASQGQQRDANLFITINLSRNKAYVGEQIIATYALYSRYANVDLAKYDLPKLNGFWAEEVDLGNTSWENEPQTVNGLQYRVAVLKRQVLFPQRAGKLRIDPFTLTCVVNRSFFNRGQTLEVRSNAVDVNVLELPGQPPAAFNGAVGDLQLSVKADRTQVKEDEAVELTVRVSGKSNLKLLEAPTIDLPADIETYEPKLTDKITVNGSGMSGYREFQYLLIPRHEGQYDIPPVELSYFDPAAGSYRTLRSEPLTLEVTAGAGSGSGGAVVQRPLQSDVKALGSDIRFIRMGPLDLRAPGRLLFGSPAWWAGMSAPVLAFLLVLAWVRRRDRELADEAGLRRKRADKQAKRHLEEAAKALRSGEKEGFHAALGRSLHGYLRDKFGLGMAQMQPTELAARIAQGEQGAALANELCELIATCDMARYAPVEDKPRQELYDKAVELIRRTEALTRS